MRGLSKKTGAEFNFYLIPGSSNDFYGIVKLVFPESNASSTSLSRGDVFNKINNIRLTINNIASLLANNSYILNMAIIKKNNIDLNYSITDGTETVFLSKEEYLENPIYYYRVINKNIGYLMYNSFTSEFDNKLNEVFNHFKLHNIKHLVIDLRYNPGGSIQTATALGSMITGQFNNKIFTKLKYNEELQTNNLEFKFTDTLNNNRQINSLNFTKIYVLTSKLSASASEMIINSLKPYIEVVHIGDTTVGKSQASQLIYDSSYLSRLFFKPKHTYALLPLIAGTVNKSDESVPNSGIVPTISIPENPLNYGIIGNSDEPLLQAALNHIQNGGSKKLPYSTEVIVPLVDFDTLNCFKNLMYI